MNLLCFIFIPFLFFNCGFTEENLEKITVSIHPSWEQYAVYNNLLANAEPRFTVQIYKADFPLLAFRFGRKDEEAPGTDQFIFANIPHDWVTVTSQPNKRNVPIVLEITLPKIRVIFNKSFFQLYIF